MTLYLHPPTERQAHIQKNDLVAQLVEHLTFNEVALGSNPSQVTKLSPTV